MNKAIVLVGALVAVAGCGQTPPSDSAISRLPAEYRKRITDINRMDLAELTRWVGICAPYNGSIEGRARNPYDPMDCDEVQFRHDSWHQPRSPVTTSALPALH